MNIAQLQILVVVLLGVTFVSASTDASLEIFTDAKCSAKMELGAPAVFQSGACYDLRKFPGFQKTKFGAMPVFAQMKCTGTGKFHASFFMGGCAPGTPELKPGGLAGSIGECEQTGMGPLSVKFTSGCGVKPTPTPTPTPTPKPTPKVEAKNPAPTPTPKPTPKVEAKNPAPAAPAPATKVEQKTPIVTAAPVPTATPHNCSLNATQSACTVSSWSTWSSCKNGDQKRSRVIKSAPCGHSRCPHLHETRKCNTTTPAPAPANCVYITSSWSTCKNGTATRSKIPAKGSPASCKVIAERKTCSVNSCCKVVTPSCTTPCGCAYKQPTWTKCANGVSTLVKHPVSTGSCKPTVVKQKPCCSYKPTKFTSCKPKCGSAGAVGLKKAVHVPTKHSASTCKHKLIAHKCKVAMKSSTKLQSLKAKLVTEKKKLAGGKLVAPVIDSVAFISMPIGDVDDMSDLDDSLSSTDLAMDTGVDSAAERDDSATSVHERMACF